MPRPREDVASPSKGKFMSIPVPMSPVVRMRLPLWRRPMAQASAGALVLVVVAVWALTHTWGSPHATRAIGARLDLAAGDVSVTEATATQKAISGTPLAIGARIATGKGSRALVRTGDGASVFLRGETEI